MTETQQRQVLIVGFDPATVPNVDATQVMTALQLGRDAFAGSDLVPTECLVPLDETALDRVREALRVRPYDCVVIGGGIREPEPLLELFEAVVNLIRLHAPQAAIAFNSNPTDSRQVAERALGGTLPATTDQEIPARSASPWM